MMTYEIFKGYAKERIMWYAPECMKNAKAKIIQQYKTNEIVDKMIIDDGSGCLPALDLRDLYNEYIKIADFDNAMRTAFAWILEAKPEVVTPIDFSDKTRVIMSLVNTEWNKELLQNLPHRKFLDLSVVYLYYLSDFNGKIASIKITFDLAKSLGLNEEELFKLASENTTRILGEDSFDMFPLIALTNKQTWNGAVRILDKETFVELSEELNDDLYILPSSIHEILVCPASGLEPREAKTMVKEVNRDIVNVQERLSHSVYIFYKETAELSII